MGLTPSELRELVADELEPEAAIPPRAAAAPPLLAQPPPPPAPQPAAAKPASHALCQRQLEQAAVLLALQQQQKEPAFRYAAGACGVWLVEAVRISNTGGAYRLPPSARSRVCAPTLPLCPHAPPHQLTGTTALEPATPVHGDSKATSVPSLRLSGGSGGGAARTPAAAAAAAAQPGGSSCSQTSSSHSRFESVNRVAAVAGRDYVERRSSERRRRSEDRERQRQLRSEAGALHGASMGASALSAPPRIPRGSQQPAWVPPLVATLGGGSAAQRLAGAGAGAAAAPATPSPPPEFDSSAVAAWLAATSAAASGAPPPAGPDHPWAPNHTWAFGPASLPRNATKDGAAAAPAATAAPPLVQLPAVQVATVRRSSPARILSAPSPAEPQPEPGASPAEQPRDPAARLRHSSSVGDAVGSAATQACATAGGSNGDGVCSRFNPVAALWRLLRPRSGSRSASRSGSRASTHRPASTTSGRPASVTSAALP